MKTRTASVRRVPYLNDDDAEPLVKMTDILGYVGKTYRLYGPHEAL